MLSLDPFSTRDDITRFMEEARKYYVNEQDINLLVSIFKLATFLNIVIIRNDGLHHKNFVQGIIYDMLNSLIAIMNLRERYLHLNLRSMIEHIARIALDKIYKGDDFDGTVRRKDFDYLKKERGDENWKYMHDTYTRACDYVHSSPKANLNTTSKFIDLMKNDHVTKPSKQIITLQKLVSAIIKIFIIYYEVEISTAFFRSQSEIRYLLGPNLYKEYEIRAGRVKA
ncbi:hypothetical protein SM001_003800 [Cronobacter sakazakii]|nr:hypothetical protein [Cronobacter sakazakii]